MLAERTVDMWHRLAVMSDIVAIDITHHQLPLDPPFPASWDPQPRTKFPATIVRVRDSDGRVGIGSGDVDVRLRRLRPLLHRPGPAGDLERHAAVLANIEFHAGRPWPLDLALWDLAGKIRGQPVWRCSAARRPRCGSTPRAACAARSRRWSRWPGAWSTHGFAALKIRFGRPAIADDIAVVAAVRDASGDRLDADGRLQPGLADAVGHAARRGTSTRPPTSPRSSQRPRRVLDGGAAAPRRLRRHAPSCAAGSTSGSPAAR